MLAGDDNDLQHVGILMRLSKSKLLSRFLKFGFSVDKLKSPNKKKFSYEELKKFNESFISFMKDTLKVVYSFLVVTISCLRY